VFKTETVLIVWCGGKQSCAGRIKQMKMKGQRQKGREQDMKDVLFGVQWNSCSLYITGNDVVRATRRTTDKTMTSRATISRTITRLLVAGLLPREPGFTPRGHSVLDLWWTKWHWCRIPLQFFSLPLPLSFHRSSPYSYITWGWTIGSLMAAVQRHSLAPSTWTRATME
jgi:hypothetical protein